MEIYKVGGAVRDELLGIAHQDSDWVVVGATPQEMIDLGYQQVGKDFPVFLHPESREEYALARTERKTAPGYTGFQFYAAPDVSLAEDLRRRDLTINAIAQTTDGEIIDPFGGLHDLKQRTLRHVSPAFAEDPVRILRLARFAARFAPLGFSVAPETIALMSEMVACGEVDALVPERVWRELVRALGENEPSPFFTTLRACGALRVIFPEIDRLFGVPQRADYHPEIDTGIHTMMVLDQAARLTDDSTIRFAALLHDLGKGTTPPETLPRHTGHEERSVALVKALCDRLRVPRDYRDLAVHVAHHHGLCHRALELRPSTILKLLKAIDAFRRPQRLEAFLLACQADYQGRLGWQARDYPQANHLRAAYAAASALSVANLVAAGYAGVALGEQLQQQQIEAIAHLHAENSRADS